jgi:hypothetical protein
VKFDAESERPFFHVSAEKAEIDFFLMNLLVQGVAILYLHLSQGPVSKISA